MARPATIDNERILKAAREVFLRRGVTASTAEVAKKANVSHGSIFNRFKTKAELFHCAMTAPLLEEEWLKVFEYDPKRDIRQQFCDIAEKMITQMRQMMPLMMMSWSERSHKRSLEDRIGDKGAFESLVTRFESLIEQHRAHKQIAKCNPRAVVLSFFGTLHLFSLAEIISVHRGLPAPPIEQYISDFIDTLWTGLSPKTVKIKARKQSTAAAAARRGERR